MSLVYPEYSWGVYVVEGVRTCSCFFVRTFLPYCRFRDLLFRPRVRPPPPPHSTSFQSSPFFTRRHCSSGSNRSIEPRPLRSSYSRAARALLNSSKRVSLLILLDFPLERQHCSCRRIPPFQTSRFRYRRFPRPIYRP